MSKASVPDIAKLKDAIARVWRSGLPEMVGRSFPSTGQEVREKLCQSKEAYVALDRGIRALQGNKIEEEDARLLLRICRRVGDLIHYEHDPALHDIVVSSRLAGDGDEFCVGRQANPRSAWSGGVHAAGRVWNDPSRPAEFALTTPGLHPLFLRLMERFDLSYKVAMRPTEDAWASGSAWEGRLESRSRHQQSFTTRA